MEADSSIAASKQGIKRRHLSERAWRELFKRFDGAALTVQAFCQREGLSRSSFHRWRCWLVPQARSVAAAAYEPDDRRIAPSFVDLGVLGVSSAAAPAGLELRLDLGGGLSLTLVRR
jgi:hypothetical protein